MSDRMHSNCMKSHLDNLMPREDGYFYARLLLLFTQVTKTETRVITLVSIVTNKKV